MKSMNIIFIALYLFSPLFLLSSCNDDSGDTTRPDIDLHAPAEGDTLQIGSEHGIHFDMTLEDDEMLASYKVDIHPNFNGHTHTKNGDHTEDFEFQKSWDVSGNRSIHIHHHEIIIPETATPGNYHLMVYCTDAAGNQSFIARNIVLDHHGDSGHHEHSGHE